MGKTFPFRALQLDLARQPETVECIKERISLISKYGYNYLFLYLEGRIRTKSFSGFPESYSYSEDEIKDIVKYADENRIELIPVVSFFGHAEHFLENSEFSHLGELAGGIEGRFSSRNHVFCPSNPDALDFIERYATEVAALFPGRYFHAGFDEAWDIGYCERCKKRLEKEGQAGIYASHLKNIHAIVTKKLGRKMMIWDDLFDIYPSALSETPRDIILCAWHYDKIVERPFGHAGGPREDHFAKYDRMGFKYIFAPAVFSLRNITTFTDYAEKSNTMGGLLTIWGDTDSTVLPAIIYAGRLWNGEDVTPASAIKEATPLESVTELALAEFFLNDKFFFPSADPGSYLKGILNAAEYDFMLFTRAASEAFIKYEPQNDATMDELIEFIRGTELYFLLRQEIPKLYTPGVSNSIAKALPEIKKLASEISGGRKAIEKRLRPDRPGTRYLGLTKSLLEMTDNLPEKGPLAKALLKVRYPEKTTALSFHIRYKDSFEWKKIEAANFGGGYFTGEFLISYPFDPEGEIEALRISKTAYRVGARVMYAEIETEDALYQPYAILNIEGRVNNPEVLLNDGRDSAELGDGECLAFNKFNHQEYANGFNSVEILMRKSVK